MVNGDSHHSSKNQLAKVTQGAMVINYTYDSSGNRISKSQGDSFTLYPSKSYNVDSAGKKTVSIIAPFGMIANTETKLAGSPAIYTFANDHLGSGQVTTDASGVPVEVQAYNTFGDSNLNDKSESFDSQRKYIGEMYDSDTGLNYLNARYYNASIGRFISQDPAFWDGSHIKEQLVDPQTWNSYSYARNNPIIYTDQQGKFAFLIPVLVYATPSIIAAGTFIATQPALVGMIGNAFTNRPVESSIRSTPIVGDVIDAGEAISGKDVFSGNSLSWSDRAISGLAATVPIVAGGVVRNEAKMSGGESNWGNPKTLQKHFNDHGADFGAKNPGDYANRASSFWGESKQSLEGKQAWLGNDNKIRVYEKDTNTFGVYNSDRTTSSFYKPSAGERYIENQMNKGRLGQPLNSIK